MADQTIVTLLELHSYSGGRSFVVEVAVVDAHGVIAVGRHPAGPVHPLRVLVPSGYLCPPGTCALRVLLFPQFRQIRCAQVRGYGSVEITMCILSLTLLLPQILSQCGQDYQHPVIAGKAAAEPALFFLIWDSCPMLAVEQWATGDHRQRRRQSAEQVVR